MEGRGFGVGNPIRPSKHGRFGRERSGCLYFDSLRVGDRPPGMARGGCGWASQIGNRHFFEADGALDEGAAAEGRAPRRPRAPLEKVPVPFLREGLWAKGRQLKAVLTSG